MQRRGKSATAVTTQIVALLLALGVAACAANDTPAGDPGSFKPYIGGQLGTSFGQSFH
jgi:hypothetical protein